MIGSSARLAALLSLLVLRSTAAADAQHCDRALLAESQATGDVGAYHKEPEGHCEGLYRRRDASSGIEIVGLSRGALDTNQPSNKLSWSAGAGIELRVYGAGAGGSHFRMDLDLPGTAHEFDWPTKTLRGIGRPGTSFALLLRQPTKEKYDGLIVHIPVTIGAAVSAPIELRIVCPQALATAKLTVRRLDDVGSSPGVAPVELERLGPSTIGSFPLGALMKGRYKADVVGTSSRGNTLSAAPLVFDIP
jgi:hypothetical protein